MSENKSAYMDYMQEHAFDDYDPDEAYRLYCEDPEAATEDIERMHEGCPDEVSEDDYEDEAEEWRLNPCNDGSY